MVHMCIYCGMQWSATNQRTFHSFPLTNAEKLKKWLSKIDVPLDKINASSRLCSDHFQQNCFKEVMYYKILKDDAVPTVFGDRKSACFYCKEKRSRGTKRSLFKCPFGKPEILKNWIANIPKPNFKPTETSVLCSQHFEKHCFKENGSLKEKSVPTVSKQNDFPDMKVKKGECCKFCLQLIPDGIVSVPIDKIENMIKQLLPDNEIIDSPTVCWNCVRHLQSAYNFMKVANENNLKILDATIENDDDLCQTCLTPVEYSYVYLYDHSNNVEPLPVIKRMLECSFIFLNLEYRRYPIMCNMCWEILRASYIFLTSCIKNGKQVYKEHNYTSVDENLAKRIRDVMSDQQTVNNSVVDRDIIRKKKSEKKTKKIIITQEIKEENDNIIEEQYPYDSLIASTSSNTAGIQQDLTKNAIVNISDLIEKIDDNFDCLEIKEYNAKLSLEEIKREIKKEEEIVNNLHIKTENKIHNITENDNCNIMEKYKNKMNLPNGYKKDLYVKLEKSVLTDNYCLTEERKISIQMYQCHLCPFITKKKYKYSRHLTTHMTLEECAKKNALYKCNNCSYMTKLKYSLRRHMKQVHRSMYICEICNYETNENDTFMLHVKLQHNNNMVTFNCEKCSYSCCTKLQLKHHVKTHDLKKIILKCSECVFETKKMVGIEKHMMTHKDMRVSKLYKCEMCTYQVKKKSSISRHILTHLTKKDLFNSNVLHECHECDYKTKRKDSLGNHIRICHKNSKGIKRCLNVK